MVIILGCGGLVCNGTSDGCSTSSGKLPVSAGPVDRCDNVLARGEGGLDGTSNRSSSTGTGGRGEVEGDKLAPPRYAGEADRCWSTDGALLLVDLDLVCP